MSKVDYALSILEAQKYKLNSLKDSLENDTGFYHVPDPKREITKLIHEIGSLDFAIEVLETYLD